MGIPDFGLALHWDTAYEFGSGYWWTAGAGNIIVGPNPPYALSDFIGWYPKFLGTALTGSATTTAASAMVTLAPGVAGIAAGQLISGSTIPLNTTTLTVSADGSTLTLSAPATSTYAGSPVQVYPQPLVPIGLLNTYIALASASLAQARYGDSWSFAMALFVAHYCTLWLLTEGLPGQDPQQIALAASQRGVGVLTSKSADGVGASYQANAAAAGWGSFGLTAYGVQLVGLAKIAGMGGMWVG